MSSELAKLAIFVVICLLVMILVGMSARRANRQTIDEEEAK